MSAFDTCLPILLKEEGGLVNDPNDNGGLTNLGVTQRAWSAWVDHNATPAEMRALTQAKVAPLYKARYWDVCRCDDLPAPLALCVFDMAVNAGPGRSAKFLQTLVGASRDGQVGPATLAAVNAFVTAHGGVAEAVRRFQQLRRDYYRQCDDFPHFGRGWLARVDTVETAALRLA